MAPDLVAELALIEASRIQRLAVERLTPRVLRDDFVITSSSPACTTRLRRPDRVVYDDQIG